MKNLFLMLTLFSILFTSCKDDDNKDGSTGNNGKVTFLQFKRDVLNTGVREQIVIYTSGFDNSKDWVISAQNKETKASTSLIIEEVITSDKKTERITLDVPPLLVGSYELIIREKDSKKELRESFIVTETSWLQMADGWGIPSSLNYGYFVDDSEFEIYLTREVVAVSINFKWLPDRYKKAYLQNKVTNELYIVDLISKYEYDESEISIPGKITPGYYYVWVEDADRNKVYYEKALLIDYIPHDLDINASTGKNNLLKSIVNGISSPFKFKSGESILITSKNLVYTPSETLLPQPNSFDSGSISVEWSDDRLGELSMRLNKSKNELKIYIPQKGEEGYDKRPLTDPTKNFYTGGMIIKSNYQSMYILTDIDYN